MTTTMPPPPYPRKRFGWVKWVLLAILLVVGIPAGCTYAIFGALGNSEATKLALVEAGRHPIVVQKLGEPLKQGWITSGSIRLNNADGTADLSIPVSGPKGSGRIQVKASKAAGRWTVEQLTVTPDDGSSPIHVRGGGIRS